MSDKKYIRFIDSGYNTLFHICDGDTIKVNSAWDGKAHFFPCKYVDDYHFEIQGNCYHICQFAELMERNGNTYEPVSEIGDLEFYQKKYLDRDNIGVNGKPVPYYAVIEQVSGRGTSVEKETVYGFCLSPSSPERAFCKHTWERYPGDTTKSFAADIGSLCDDEKLCIRINNIVSAIKDAQNKEAPSLDETIKTCEQQAVASPRIPGKEEEIYR